MDERREKMTGIHASFVPDKVGKLRWQIPLVFLVSVLISYRDGFMRFLKHHTFGTALAE